MAIVQYYTHADLVDEAEYSQIDDDDKYTLSEPEIEYSHDDTGFDLRTCAQECAGDYHNHHDGWEDGWPIYFILWIDGVCKGKFFVEREYEPAFTAILDN